jgi:23S rRNA (guanine745-N1)-methyltransferase
MRHGGRLALCGRAQFRHRQPGLYTHLLPVQNKRSRDPGDSKEMVAARRRFLEAGCYYGRSPTRWRHRVLADMPPANAQPASMPAAARATTCASSRRGTVEARTLALAGLDISKWAVQAAAKRDLQDARSRAGADPSTAWIVGSNAGLPVLPGTLDRVLCMFGFPVYPEFARVLRPGGELLQVDAGPDHLRELREVIYPALKPERPASRAAPPGFTHLASDTLRFQIHVDGAAQIADLLAMTPHLYRASAEGRARAAALVALTMTVDVRLARYRRQPG